MDHSESKELIRVKIFTEDAKYREALKILKKLNDIEGFSPLERVEWSHLKSRCLNRLGQFEKALKIAKDVYKESQGLKKPLLTLDALIEMAEALVAVGRLEKMGDLMTEADVLLKEITEIPSKDLKKREASSFLYLWILFNNSILII